MKKNTTGELGRIIQSCLSPDLLKPAYRNTASGRHPMYGHCYVASEALFHMGGGFDSQYRPKVITHEGSTHWFLEHRETGERHDLTAAQFYTPVPYEKARWCGFLTREPSKRTQKVLSLVREKLKPRR